MRLFFYDITPASFQAAALMIILLMLLLAAQASLELHYRAYRLAAGAAIKKMRALPYHFFAGHSSHCHGRFRQRCRCRRYACAAG